MADTPLGFPPSPFKSAIKPFAMAAPRPAQAPRFQQTMPATLPTVMPPAPVADVATGVLPAAEAAPMDAQGKLGDLGQPPPVGPLPRPQMPLYRGPNPNPMYPGIKPVIARG